MRKSLLVFAAAVALAGGVATAAPSLADHLPAEQHSPCRPNPPAGEQAVGYDDADVRRDLPTIYYNTTDPQRAYVGACGGGSAGEPIRYVEIRMTPGGPYVYGSDAAGGRSFGGCVEEDPGVPNRWVLDRHCVGAEVPGDARGASVAAATSPNVSYYSEEDAAAYYTHSKKRVEVAAAQDGVTLTHYTDRYYPNSGEDVRTNSETFAVTRNDNGVVALTRTTSSGCELRAEDDLRDTDPPVYTESGDGNCPAPVRVAGFLVDYLVGEVKDELPAPEGVPAPAACRPSPEPGEQTVPLGTDAPATVYVNTTAAQPYAGACTGGTGGEPVRFVEVRQTAGGPFVYQSDGSSGHVVDSKCLPVIDNVGDNRVSVCASAALTPSRTDASLWVRRGGYSWEEEGVRASQSGVEVFHYTSDEGNETQYLRRSPDGRVERGRKIEFFGFTCDSGYRINLADPPSSGTYEEGDFC